MATCPVCQSSLEITAQHHGTLYTCPRCSAVFFVDWNGEPEVATPEESSLDFSPSQPVESGSHQAGPSSDFSPANDFAGEFTPAQELSNNSDVGFEPAYDPAPAYSSDSIEEAPLSDEPISSEPASSYEASPSFEAASSYEEANENHSDAAMDFQTEMQPFDTVSSQPMNAAEAFADVTDFGNAETSQSAFNYSVQISGIDSAQVRKDLADALNDSKFGWDSVGLLSQIKDGTLTIRSVSAVKASILVQRIKYLPIKVSWRQDVLSGSV